MVKARKTNTIGFKISDDLKTNLDEYIATQPMELDYSKVSRMALVEFLKKSLPAKKSRK